MSQDLNSQNLKTPDSKNRMITAIAIGAALLNLISGGYYVVDNYLNRVDSRENERIKSAEESHLLEYGRIDKIVREQLADASESEKYLLEIQSNLEEGIDVCFGNEKKPIKDNKIKSIQKSTLQNLRAIVAKTPQIIANFDFDFHTNNFKKYQSKIEEINNQLSDCNENLKLIQKNDELRKIRNNLEREMNKYIQKTVEKRDRYTQLK